MKNNIACCYLSHNHPYVVKEVLTINLEYYNKNGIDIYIYDSSTNNETKEIVNEFIHRGANNLYYIKIDDKLEADGKMLQVLKRYGIEKKYDYIWPCKDRSYVTEKSAENIQRASQHGHESIFLDYWIPIESDRREYKLVYEKKEFFYEFGWMTTSWEAVLFNTRLLDKLDPWDKYEKQYNLGKQNGFNQVVVLFVGLTLIENACVEVLNCKNVTIHNCALTSSGWIPYTFDTWGKNWPKAIKSLPKCYDENKEKIILDQGMHPIVFGSMDNLIALKERGILNRKKWDEVKTEWSILSKIPSKDVEAILDGDYEWLVWDVYEKLNEELEKEEYDTAYFIFTRTSYLKVLFGEKNYGILKKCFDIYLNEIHNKKKIGILYQVRSCEDLLYKYQVMKYLVRRLEFDIPMEEDLIAFCHDNHVTMEFLMSVIRKETINREKVVDEIEKIFEKG